MENRDKFAGSSEFQFGLENAIARIVRRRWPSKTVEEVQAEWDLTRGQAQGVVFAIASRSTINAIIRHKRGGLKLLIELGTIMTGETLQSVLQQEIRELENEARRAAEEAARLALVESRFDRSSLGDLASLSGLRFGDAPARNSKRDRTERSPARRASDR